MHTEPAGIDGGASVGSEGFLRIVVSQYRWVAGPSRRSSGTQLQLSVSQTEKSETTQDDDSEYDRDEFSQRRGAESPR